MGRRGRSRGARAGGCGGAAGEGMGGGVCSRLGERGAWESGLRDT